MGDLADEISSVVAQLRKELRCAPRVHEKAAVILPDGWVQAAQDADNQNLVLELPNFPVHFRVIGMGRFLVIKQNPRRVNQVRLEGECSGRGFSGAGVASEKGETFLSLST